MLDAMPVAQRVQNLKTVAMLAVSNGEFSFALRDFLDGFYESPSSDALADEPQFLDGVIADGARLDAYLAAVAEHLCRMHGYPLPRWTGQERRFLKLPWFAMKSHSGRMLLLMDSPSAFRARNIFVSADALSRV